MSVLTKKHPTDKVEILINQGRVRRWVGPKSKLRLVRDLLSELDFKPVEIEKGVSWRELVKEGIKENGEPGLMLQGARHKEELTQVQLAKKLGMPQSHISAMENGSRPIGKVMAKRLAKVFKMDYRVFL